MTRIFPTASAATSLIALCATLAGAPALAQYAYLDDANYESNRAMQAPLSDHLFPRTILSETKGLPKTAEAISKYDSIRVNAYQMSSTLIAAQKLNPDLFVMRAFILGGLQGSTMTDPCSSAYSPPFGSTGAATANCEYFAGHWAYYAGTTTSQALSSSGLTVTVASGSRITPNRYVVIYDAPMGSFKNAEHALVQSVSGNTVTFASRGFKSVARSHPTGAIIAEHPVAAGTDGVEAATHWLYNLSSQCPRDANGKRMIDVIAAWLAKNLELGSNGKPIDLRIDGVVFDTDAWSISWRTTVDIDNDLVGDGGWDRTTGTNLWGEGSDELYQLVRDAFPDKFVVGGDRYVRGFDALNGTQMEGWPVSGVYHAEKPEYKNIDELLANYVTHMGQGPGYLPAFTENLTKTPTRYYPDGASPVPSSNAPFRFALGTTLLDDGYFAQEPTGITPDPWWDEFAVDVKPGSSTYGQAIKSNPSNEALTRQNRGWLGLPLGGRERVYDTTAFAPTRTLLANGALDNAASLSGWKGSNVTIALDTTQKIAGGGALRVSKHNSYALETYQATVKTPTFAVKAGVEYTLAFAVRAEQVRGISLTVGGSTQNLIIPDRWVRQVVTFTPTSSGTISATFNVGREDVPMWLDEVYLFEGNADVFTRAFENGLVVVNATAKTRTVDLGGTYQHIKGTGQDVINSGAKVTSVTLAAYDAVLLVNPEQAAVRLGIADATVSEGGGTARFAVNLSAASRQQVTVRYASANDSAVAGSDYQAVSGTLSFPAGTTQRTIEVPVLNDSLYESGETFSLVLSNAAGATIAQDTGTGTISDDDPMPTLSLGNVSVGEGDDEARLVVNLSAASSLPVTVNYASTNGSAVAGSDYQAVPGTLTFPAGETQQTISVSILDDTLVESVENFSVSLSNANGATIGQGTATVSLTDNDVKVGPACGAPVYNSATEAGVFIYNDCSDPQQWHVRIIAGGQVGSYRGSVSAEQRFTSLASVSQESTDVLSPAPFTTTTAGPISFVQNVGSTGYDGFDFRLPAGASACFNLTSPTTRPIRVGADRVSVTGPINLTTLKACSP